MNDDNPYRFVEAREEEDSADAPGVGRAPKARRHFRQMRMAAEHELFERGKW